jgi:hypothetical protein
MTNKELEMVIEIKEAELAGLKAKLETGAEQKLEPEKKVGKGKKAAKAKPEPEVEEEETEEDGADDYESMTSTALYKLCCERGISSKCKKRDKKTLIAVLKENDAAQDDDWEDEEDEQETDPYAGKTAKELYKMCKDRGLAATPKKPADVYAKILKKADAEAAKKANTKAQVEEDEEDEDDWEI